MAGHRGPAHGNCAAPTSNGRIGAAGHGRKGFVNLAVAVWYRLMGRWTPLKEINARLAAKVGKTSPASDSDNWVGGPRNPGFVGPQRRPTVNKRGA
jgi:hypothetical protein